MLTGLRSAFEKGIARFVLIALMAVLVLSFAVWGIGDIFRGGTATTVATVGDTQINVQTFQTAYNREVQNLGRMVGRGLTPDQARQFGIDQRVLNQLVTEATLDERGRQLGLGIDDDTIRTRIVSTPQFRGPTGQFDRTAFQEVLRQNGYNEQTYIDLERRLAVRQQIAGAVSDKLGTPQVLIDAMTRFQNETRQAQYVVIGATQAGEVPLPTRRRCRPISTPTRPRSARPSSASWWCSRCRRRSRSASSRCPTRSSTRRWRACARPPSAAPSSS